MAKIRGLYGAEAFDDCKDPLHFASFRLTDISETLKLISYFVTSDTTATIMIRDVVLKFVVGERG